MKSSHSRTAMSPLTAALLGLVVPMFLSLPAHAQRIDDLPKLSVPPLATDADLLKLGIAQGDVIIPYSNLQTPEEVGVTLHTNFLISRRTARAAEGLPPTIAMTAMGIALTSPAALSFALPLLSAPLPQSTGSSPYGNFYPSDLKTAYGLPSTGGQGTIVVVGAYDYSAALTDFNRFCTDTGLVKETSSNVLLNTNKVFQIVYATGRKPNAPPNANFGIEAALDIEWAHAMAPQAKIVLVEGTTNAGNDLLYGAVAKGNNLPNVHELSMSYGGGEYSSETYFDGVFSKSGFVYFASSGDTGGQILWPSCATNVVGVGGTTLVTNSTTQAYVSETGWSGSGGGVSQYESKPSYQTGVTYNGTSASMRTSPDVAMLADPNTGVYVIYNNTVYTVGGTSLASPLVAGVVNLSATNRASSNAELTQLYSVFKGSSYSTYFRDITSGTAGSFSCYPGYDLVTGIGTPKGYLGF